jgi:hypothetical protein
MGSLNIDSTGQFASVLLQAPSKSSFLAVAQTLVLIVTPASIGESAGFSASTVVSTLTSSILNEYAHFSFLLFHHLAHMRVLTKRRFLRK